LILLPAHEGSQPDHHVKTLPLGKVKQPARRHVVGSDVFMPFAAM